jgi:predicted dehydrogenase
MNRRDVLSTIAVTGTGVGLVMKAKAYEKNAISPGQPIRVALIGAQKIGAKTHLPTLVGDPDCRLVAICDVDKKILAEAMEQANGLYAAAGVQASIRAFGDFRDVIADPSIDAVVVAVPDHWHVPIAKAAVLAGKDVYVEKPLSLYVTEGRELIELAKNRDVMVQVGSQHRSDTRFFLAQAIVQSGMLGEIKQTEVTIKTRSGDGIPWAPQPVPPELDYDMYVGPVQWTDYHPERVHYNFRFVPEFSGGEIANWGAHFLDSAQQALGLDDTGPVKVEGKGKRHPAGSLHTSYYDIDVDYEYANGAKIKFKSGKDNGITFYGEKAQLYVSRKTLRIDDPGLMKMLPKAEAQALRKTKGSHMQNWFSCIRSRRKEELHAPLEIANRSAILCHLANISIDLGRPLFWDPKREIFKNDAHANAMLNRPVREKWRIV